MASLLFLLALISVDQRLASYGIWTKSRMPSFFPESAADETHAEAVIARAGPLGAYRELIAGNDALIRSAVVTNGRVITSARTAIHAALVRHWAAEQQRAIGYDKPFAVVALGGTGRAEVAPGSDLDFAFLFGRRPGGEFLSLELQRQVLHSPEFKRRCGFTFLPLPLAWMTCRRWRGNSSMPFST